MSVLGLVKTQKRGPCFLFSVSIWENAAAKMASSPSFFAFFESGRSASSA